MLMLINISLLFQQDTNDNFFNGTVRFILSFCLRMSCLLKNIGNFFNQRQYKNRFCYDGNY